MYQLLRAAKGTNRGSRYEKAINILRDLMPRYNLGDMIKTLLSAENTFDALQKYEAMGLVC